MSKHYFILIKGEKIQVSEELYKAYWQESNHEKYLERSDRKHNVIPFSSLDHDGHFVENLVDERVDMDKIIETKIMMETVRKAISMLTDDEKDIIERLYFKDETIRSVAKSKLISHPALIKRRNKILEKLKNIIEDCK